MSPQVVAHRGASAAHPPGNTVAAFEAAGHLGADWVELDVRRTVDGALAVHHDAHLADGRAIVDVEADMLGPTVPLLGDALAACAGLGVNVEIKNGEGEPDWDGDRRVADMVLDALDGHDRSRLLVTSFDLPSIERVRDLDASIPTGLLAFDLSDPGAVVRAASNGGHSALNPWDHFVDEAIVALAHAAGLEVNVWTVDDPARMAALAGWGVDGIITNLPDVLRAVLNGDTARFPYHKLPDSLSS